MAKVLYAYDEKDVEQIIFSAINKSLKRNGNALLSSLEDDDAKLTQTQAAKFIGVSVPTLIGYREERGLPYERIGKPVYYYKKDLLAFSRRQNEIKKK